MTLEIIIFPYHYENLPIQSVAIYRELFQEEKLKISLENNDIFTIFAQNIEAVLTSTH